MKKLFCSVAHCSVLGLIAFCLGETSAKAIIIGSSADNGNGTYTYSYTVDNALGAFDIVAFALEFDFASSQIDWNQLDVAGGGDVTVANAAWIAQSGFPLTGLSSQDFLSLDPAGDVFTGTSLLGFSFISALVPGSLTYYEFGALGDSASGTTVGPAGPAELPTVPDTGSSIPLLSISLGFLTFGRRWYRQSSRIEPL